MPSIKKTGSAAKKPDALKLAMTRAENGVLIAREDVQAAKERLKQARKALKKAKAQYKKAKKALVGRKKNPK
jgi:outer membrane protein TolC